MTSDAKQIVTTAYADFTRGDVPAVIEKLDHDITWRIPGDHPLAGELTGRDAVVDFFKRLHERSGGTFAVDVHEILDGDAGTVAALTTISAEHNGRHGSFDTVQVWHFEDGLATSFREFHQQQEAVDAFWS